MAGQKRLSFVVLAMLAGLLSSIGVVATERGLVRSIPKNADLDESSEPVSEADVASLNQILAAGGAGSCQPVGGNTTAANGQFRYRGNVLHIDAVDAELKEFKMALRFTGTVPLSFSIHKREVSQDQEVWRRVFLRTAQAVGNGAYQMYSSGSVTLDTKSLTPNTDYAFGVTWGGTTVFFVRDSVAQPKQLAAGIGQSLGLLSYNGVQPPMAEELPNPSIATVGVYQMEFCFEPVDGACCSSTQSPPGCVQSKESACTDAGSFFHGERVDCDEVLCNFGLCCLPCAYDCHDDYTPGACERENGTHHRGGTCPSSFEARAELCPSVTGACCAQGVCTVKCARDCNAALGEVYRGDGTDCDEPHLCTGACCKTGAGCQNVTQSFCTNLVQGVFKGNGTRCASLPPAQQCGGGCCFTFGATTCSPATSREACVGSGDAVDVIYLGDAVSCPPAPGAPSNGCPTIDETVACCLPSGACVDCLPAVCVNLLGVYDPEGAGSTRCPPPGSDSCRAEACCFLDGSCELVTPDGCGRFGGYSAHPVQSCSREVCEGAISVKGACCFGDSGCVEEYTQFGCEADGGIYLGNDSICGPLTCPGFGACCTPDSACAANVSESVCGSLGGDYKGDGVLCDDEGIDCDHRGACCLPNGGCAFLVHADCDDIGGAFKGEDTLCETTNICLSGACCLGNGTCAIRGVHACNSPGAGLVYQGNNTTCTTELCTLGACCDGATCRGLPGIPQVRSQCNDTGEVFGPGQTCAADTCQVGICCLRTFDGTCVDATRVDCTNEAGSYHANTVCPDGDVTDPPCLLGACCSLSGVCEDDVFALDCESGEFTPGTLCANVTCQPRGACCIPGNDQCQIMTPGACASANGAYAGDGVNCVPGVCTTGACCSDETGCQNLSQFACNSADGSFQGPGTTCKTVECPLSCHDVIVASVPANCAVDPGYPHTPSEPPTRLRWITLDLVFECSARSLIPTDFSVREEPPNGAPRSITNVDPIVGDPNAMRLTFDQFIKLGRWTCVTHNASQEEICIGFLPGDVNADGQSDAMDLTALVNNLDMPSLPIEECDVDRSGGCFSTDLIMEIDLQNGADPMFPKGITLPACPTAP